MLRPTLIKSTLETKPTSRPGSPDPHTRPFSELWLDTHTHAHMCTHAHTHTHKHEMGLASFVSIIEHATCTHAHNTATTTGETTHTTIAICHCLWTRMAQLRRDSPASLRVWVRQDFTPNCTHTNSAAHSAVWNAIIDTDWVKRFSCELTSTAIFRRWTYSFSDSTSSFSTKL